VILERGIRGGEIAVVGLGRSGLAATRLLRQAGIRVYASDSGRSPALTGRQAGLQALRVVEAAQHSSRLGRRVTLDEV